MISPFHFVEAPLRRVALSLEQAVLEGLFAEPKTLPCRFFYNEAGSELFEQICDLPEYYPTRTERGVLERYADAMIRTAGPHPLTIVELGSGSSVKTRLLIEAALRRQSTLHYVPIDISGDFLRASAQVLAADYSALRITAIGAEYGAAMELLPERDAPRLFLFLGSNIGNFDKTEATALLTSLRCQMGPDDRLLIGVDLVKDIAVLEAAYNDSQGITAAFNKNLLVRINHELGADFDLDLWEHRAPYNTELDRIEMWLYSRADQFVTLPSAGCHVTFRKGEGIHTENSHKYTPASFAVLAAAAGLTIQETWTDPRGWFASFLLRPEGVAK